VGLAWRLLLSPEEFFPCAEPEFPPMVWVFVLAFFVPSFWRARTFMSWIFRDARTFFSALARRASA
jgi:hypothetical protein